ncbi:MAG: ATP-dependent helicase HrpB [Deltaproteobacteria bacterium]|nr:ATP-dependent helicase HrpB [Deltaproteobacteria bacterium]
MIALTDLPIKSVIPEVLQTLRKGGNAILSASPGAGKTTCVPLALLHEQWLNKQRIIMLEPRRLAARAAAMRMAELLGEKVGETVGYRTRMDSQVSNKTRIEVLTEGILTRILQNDPSLEGVGLLIFDEFHERSLHADLGLALSLESQELLREDLRILVMSATLEEEPLSRLLGSAPVIYCKGKSYPVETHYLPRTRRGEAQHHYKLIPQAKSVILRSLREEKGDMLVFLPGTGEIRRLEKTLKEGGLDNHIHIMPLYGDLSREEQNRAILPSPSGQRKIVLATSIAETSLTIEGVRVIVDCGLMRVSRFSPDSGMSRLETIALTKASARQRRGRAGRLEGGVCYRLWTEEEDRLLKAHGRPEILETDLGSLALELALWGIKEPQVLRWLDNPPNAAFAHARELLILLEAIDEAGIITPLGKEMTKLPLHPRLAHMVLKARPLGLGSLACSLAALLTERDIIRVEQGTSHTDLRLRIDALQGGKDVLLPDMNLDSGACRRVRSLAGQLRKKLAIAAKKDDSGKTGLLLAFAYPDRIAGKRQGSEGRYLMSNGKGAAFLHYDMLSKRDYLVAASLDGNAREARIFLAAPIEVNEIERNLAPLIKEKEVIVWDKTKKTVSAGKEYRLARLLLREEALVQIDSEKVTKVFIEGIKASGIHALPWSKASKNIQKRLIFMHHLDAGFPDFSDAALAKGLESLLAPWIGGMTRLEQLKQLDLKVIFLSLLSREQQQALEKLAPTHWTVPSGSRIPIDYGDPAKPVLSVRLQELFGLDKTPAIAGGKKSLTLHLLSPAHRPIQVTKDLAGFWANTYFDVKKELKGRYPKHEWPDNPLQATPTKRAKRKVVKK